MESTTTRLAYVAPVLGLLALARGADARPSIDLDVRVGNPVMIAERPNRVFMKVGLFGREAGAHARRPAVNVCIAIDRSGSMAGEKLAQARQGAIAALRRLGQEDTVSVVAYDDTVEVLVPATSAAERATIETGIAALTPGGNTALFAGVAKCAEQLRSGLDPDRVNRIILLSDGIANVGPSSPEALGGLGASLMNQGISVSTVGIGLDYNEDLMTELALRSDGRHVFVRRAEEIAAFLDQELTSVTSVVARSVELQVSCRTGVRPVRVLGREADIAGSKVTAEFGKIYAGREHFLLVELEVQSSHAGAERPLADVTVAYRDLLAARNEAHGATVNARFSDDHDEVNDNVDPKVMGVVELAMADEASQRAIELRDRGEIEEAREVLNENAERLRRKAVEYKDERLRKMERRQKSGAEAMPSSAKEWNVQRKAAKKSISDNPLEGL
jgi:Ca-activated chloride channel family protein